MGHSNAFSLCRSVISWMLAKTEIHAHFSGSAG